MCHITVFGSFLTVIWQFLALVLAHIYMAVSLAVFSTSFGTYMAGSLAVFGISFGTYMAVFGCFFDIFLTVF